MKTHLITLESHDNLISVRDRMSWAKTPRILLIWPKGEGIALRPLDLKMLQRHARSLGASLGLVTRDPLARREAQALRIPVFESPRAAQVEPWTLPGKKPLRRSRRVDAQTLRTLRARVYPAEPAWRSLSFVRMALFVLGVLPVLLLAALLLPRAEITLLPESRDQVLVIPVVADPALDSVFIAGNLPAHVLTSEISGSRQIPATGELATPEIEAEGIARFRNLTRSTVEVPQGTVVQSLGSPPIRFVTTQAARVPAGVGKVVDVPIESVAAGARGNLDVDLIQAIEGPLGLMLSVTNPAPTSGGADSKVIAPSTADRERLYSVLIESLRVQVQKEMLAGLPSGTIVFPSSVKEVAVLDENYEPPAGRMGESLSLTLRVKFSAEYASGADLSELAALSLAAATEDGFFPASGSFTFRPIGLPVTDESGRTSFDLRVERRLLRTVDLGRLFALVQGRHVESAQERLAGAFALSSPPQIKMSPRWWPWLPLSSFRIDVVIQ